MRVLYVYMSIQQTQHTLCNTKGANRNSLIHTIGDSHCATGWTDGVCKPGQKHEPADGIIWHYLGPVLCYSFGKEKLQRCDIRNFNIKDGETVVFSFGEIDCRCHIHKHIDTKHTYQDIINYIVDNYFEAIKLNVSISQIKLKNICVYNVIPPVQKCDVTENPQYPFLGTDEERKKYILYFNAKLKEKCIENNYIFFDIYNHYINENGFLRRDLRLENDIHILNGIYIGNFIKENNL